MLVHLLRNLSGGEPVWLYGCVAASDYDVSKSYVSRLNGSMHDGLWCECHVDALRMTVAIIKMHSVKGEHCMNTLFGLKLNTNGALNGIAMCSDRSTSNSWVHTVEAKYPHR